MWHIIDMYGPWVVLAFFLATIAFGWWIGSREGRT